jgi:hypothetical protein
MDTTPSKKIMWSIGALLVIAIIIAAIVYFTGTRSPEVTPPTSEGTASSGISPATVELLKQMSVTTSTIPVKSTLSTQETKKIKTAISAPATAKSSIRISERQKLLDSMSVQ